MPKSSATITERRGDFCGRRSKKGTICCSTSTCRAPRKSSRNSPTPPASSSCRRIARSWRGACASAREDREEVIQRRLVTASREIENYDRYNYILVNDSLEESIEMLQAIVRSERLLRAGRPLSPRKPQPWRWRNAPPGQCSRTPEAHSGFVSVRWPTRERVSPR